MDTDTIVKKNKTTKSEHRQVVEFWSDEVKSARGMRPIITGADAKNLKRVLDAGIQRTALEQAAMYYLYHPSFKTFSPALSTFLSAGVINAILNRKQNDANFWKDMDGILQRRGKQGAGKMTFMEQLDILRAKLAKEQLDEKRIKTFDSVFDKKIKQRLGYEREIA